MGSRLVSNIEHAELEQGRRRREQRETLGVEEARVRVEMVEENDITVTTTGHAGGKGADGWVKERDEGDRQKCKEERGESPLTKKCEWPGGD